MSLSGIMRTSTSGMAAQASRLSTVADNIANSSTTGYKRAYTEFSSMILDSSASEYQSGSVETHVRYGISQEGTLSYTTSVTDLAVKGSGFFVVSDENGQPFLTRAGSFVVDGDGNLVNAAGYMLMGYSLAPGAPTGVVNGYDGLTPVNLSSLALQANPSTKGVFQVNLPLGATAVAAANLPSANAAAATYTAKSSLVAYDNVGNEVTLDIYLTKSAANTWEVAVFNQADAAAGGGFPYAGGALATTTLTFDATTGRLAPTSPSSISIPIPNGAALTLDMSQTSELPADYTVINGKVTDGNAPSEVDHVEIADTGELYAVYENGARVATYRIPLADVPSPDNLKPLAGNVFAPSLASGDVQILSAGSGGRGLIVSGALEQSTVDLASELTSMIEAQRNYSVNSKVFQTGSELMDVLVNLKR